MTKKQLLFQTKNNIGAQVEKKYCNSLCVKNVHMTSAGKRKYLAL